MTPTYDNRPHLDFNFTDTMYHNGLWSAQVVMTEYVAGGGDGFKIIAENKEKHLQASSNQI